MRMGKLSIPFTHGSVCIELPSVNVPCVISLKEHEFSSGVHVSHHINSGAGEEKASRSKYK